MYKEPRRERRIQTMSAEEVAKAFVEHFYKTFDESGVDALAGLFVSFLST